MKKKVLVFSVIILCCLSVGQLFAQTDTRYDADKNLPFNEKAGDVNPQTGNLTLQYTDLSLPGRGGMGFSFARVWSLNQSNVYQMYFDTDSMANRLSGKTIDKVNRLGVGWSTNIPYILDDDQSGELVKTLFIGGSAFQVDYTALSFQNGPAGNETASNLIGYDLLDMRIYRSTGVRYDDYDQGIPSGFNLSDLAADSCRYVLIKKDNSRDYFREDGKIMMSQDKTGLNRIWYFYETSREGEEARLRLVVDTVGRYIQFFYTAEGCLSSISWDVTSGVKKGKVRDFSTEERRVRYEYESADEYPPVQEIKQLLYDEDRADSFVLKSVYDTMDNETLYSYAAASALFTFNSGKPVYENVYMLMTSETTCYDELTGGYKNKRFFEYDVPSSGLYTKYFYNGFMEYYKLSRQYYRDTNKRICQDLHYVYHEAGAGGSGNQYSTVVKSGNSQKRYVYLMSDIKSLCHVLQSIVVETDSGFLERRDFLYDENRAKVQEDMYRQGKWVFREKYTYDKKGNLTKSEDKNGLVTYAKYDDKFSLPVLVVKTVTVKGKKKDYVSENEINPVTGNIEATHVYYTSNVDFLKGTEAEEYVSTSRFEYDRYGNKISDISPEGNVLHTQYDDATHSLPVKMWQDVEIDSWRGGGDVHTNWQTTPDGKQLMRIRSWKVYNSDGTVWLDIDNEGFAIENYYNPRGDKIEVVEPDLDDPRAFALPLEVDGEGQAAVADFKDFFTEYLGGVGSPVFLAYFTARENNGGSFIDIDYGKSLIHTKVIMDKARGIFNETEQRSDGMGNILEEVQIGAEEEYTKRMVYDSYGRMIALTDQDRGNFLGKKVIDGIIFDRYERTWMIEYDDLGRQKVVTYPITRTGVIDVKRFEYDDVQNSILITDPEGRRLFEKHDWAGNVVESVLSGDAGGKSNDTLHCYYEYDELSRRIGFTDPGGLVTSYLYDERSLLVEQDYGNGSDYMYYNNLGLLTTKKDRNGQYITFDYDAIGRKVEVNYYKSKEDLLNINPESRVLTTYDNRGNAVRIENNHLIEHYLHDPGNRVISLERHLKDEDMRKALTAASFENPVSNEVLGFYYTYNDGGMVRSMTYPDGSTHYLEYDNYLGQLKSIYDGSEIFITNMEYNRAGVLTRMDGSNNTSQIWEFDNRKRIKHSRVESVNNLLVDLNYSLNGVGDILSVNDNEYSYDPFNRIVAAKTLIPGNEDLRKIVSQHFGAYNNEVVSGPGENFVVYDLEADINKDGRVNGADDMLASLVDESEIYDVESFSYDKNGNRTKLIQNGDEYYYTYGDRNKLEKIEKKAKGREFSRLYVAYSYDANGNTLRRINYEADGVTVKGEVTFTYDVLNRLVKSTESRGGENLVTSYIYDNAGNRLIKRNENKSTLYLRHGQVTVAMDIELPGADYQFEEGQEYKCEINRYVLSGDLLAGRITRRINKDDTQEVEKYWYHLDHLNSTKAITTEDGTLSALYEYRAFGEELKKLGEGEARYTYGGKEHDDETNLYYFNARYYDATTGRFINVDPVQDGINWYVYCNNNPLNRIDPTGLEDDQVVEGTRFLAKWLIGNPANAYATKNGWFKDIFWAAGFVQDVDGVYHARQDCLQQYGGYNDFYDTVFHYATSMDKAKFEFSMDGQDYIFWAWKGNYLNLGAGAEMGIYKRFSDTNHWSVDKDLALPMTLKLTDSNGNTIVDYNPGEDLWWVTGFNPNFQGVDAGDLTATYTVDFSGNKDMYDAFSSEYKNDDRWEFDQEKQTGTFTF